MMEQARRNAGSKRKIIAALIPYFSVAIGLYMLKSAWIAMLVYHVGICLALAAYRDWAAVKSLLSGFKGRRFVLLMPVYLSVGVILYYVWPVAKLDHVVLADRLRAFGLDPGRMWGFITYYCMVNATLEEVFWRGSLMDTAKRPSLGDLLFSGYHVLVMALFVSWFWNIVSFALLAGAAWIWRNVARSTGGLALPWLTHMIADASVMAAVYLIVNYQTTAG
ncbi:MAG: CPBP family glutamic-type intramembrane protease [Myxococcota bacterium]|nr:CPBP family glutamic-type intramembrane protease [Myxococcota bacterium]